MDDTTEDTAGSATDNVVDIEEVRRGAAARAAEDPEGDSGATRETTWSITIEGKGTEPMSRAELSRTLNAAKEAKFTRDQITPGMKQIFMLGAATGFAVGLLVTAVTVVVLLGVSWGLS